MANVLVFEIWNDLDNACWWGTATLVPLLPTGKPDWKTTAIRAETPTDQDFLTWDDVKKYLDRAAEGWPRARSVILGDDA